MLGHPFDPWQEFAVIHAGEKLPDGRPRFRLVLIIVARQNGKTEIPVVLSLQWMFVDRWPLTLGTSTKLDYAQESWEKAIKIARQVKPLWRRVPRRGGIRRANGEQRILTSFDTRYKIAPANDEGGRSLTIDRLVLDELRQHHDYSAWAASVPAVSARPRGQIWAMSNAGDDNSIVLNDKRDDALAFIRWWDENGDQGVAELLLAGHRPPGMPDFRIGIFEWSAPEDFDELADDDTVMSYLMQANPNAGHPEHGADPDELLAGYHTARLKGGKAWATYRTEYMCVRVAAMDAAINAAAWKRNAGPVDLAGLRYAMCVDVSPDLQHATLAAAAVLPGLTRIVQVRQRDGGVRAVPMPVVAVDLVEAWDGPTAIAQMIAALPELIGNNRPAALGWMPSGPAAAAASSLRDRTSKGQFYPWPPPGVVVAEIAGEVPAVCMGFSADVDADLVMHGDDPLLNAHALGAGKRTNGVVWVFDRIGTAEGDAVHVDAVYAAAGAVHLAKTLPAHLDTLGMITLEDDE